jgi:pilus assembly protein TadC
MFWFIYILAACIVAGMLALLVRAEVRKEKAVTINLKEGLLGAAMMFVPIFNAIVAVVLIWFYISEYGGKHTVTFGEEQDPK